MSYKYSPIVIFVYNRFSHTKEMIEALKLNELAKHSDLYIFSDGAKNDKDIDEIKKIRIFLENIKGFSSINLVFNDKNLGLAKSIITGVSKIIKIYGKVIVLEDDIITSTSFLNFMNDSLDLYNPIKNICSISGYSLPIVDINKYKDKCYISGRSWSWGWATWHDRWDEVNWELSIKDDIFINKSKQSSFNKYGGNDLYKMLEKQFDGKIDSWYIRWQYHHFLTEKYCLYPTCSLVQNIGLDGTGTHNGSFDKFNTNISEYNFTLPKEMSFDKQINKKLYKFISTSILKKILVHIFKNNIIYIYIKRVCNKNGN